MEQTYKEPWRPMHDQSQAWESWLGRLAVDPSQPLQIVATLGHAWAGSKSTISGRDAYVFEPVLTRVSIIGSDADAPIALMSLEQPGGDGTPLTEAFWERATLSEGVTPAMYAALSQHFISKHRELTHGMASTHVVLEDPSKGTRAPVRTETLKMDFRTLVQHMVATHHFLEVIIGDEGEGYEQRVSDARFAMRMLEVPFNARPMSREAMDSLAAEFRGAYAHVMQFGQYYDWFLRSEKMLSSRTTEAEADEQSSIYGGGKKTRAAVYAQIDRFLEIGWDKERTLDQLKRVMGIHPRHQALAATMIDERIEERALQAQVESAGVQAAEVAEAAEGVSGDRPRVTS